MILKTSPFSIQDKNKADPDDTQKEYQTLDNLMSEKNILSKSKNTVHRRRDLDSLG